LQNNSIFPSSLTVRTYTVNPFIALLPLL
jgi:hypothetical protein